MSEQKQQTQEKITNTEDIQQIKQQQKPVQKTEETIHKSQKASQENITKNTQKQSKEGQQQMPDKFYDSDLASVNQKDILSDNEPPKDIAQQRKLLHKQKSLHIYKTILRVGIGIDKPAPFDQIKLRYLQQTQTSAQGIKKAKQLSFIENAQFEVYNLGKKNKEIERLVTSMRQGQIAAFQLQELQVSKKSNIKVLKQRQMYVIQVQKWTTVIDIDSNIQILKYILRRGEGPHRVSKYDQVIFQASIEYKQTILQKYSFQLLKIQQQTIQQMHPIIWKMLQSMKRNQLARVNLSEQSMKQIYSRIPEYQTNQNQKQNQNGKNSQNGQNGEKIQYVVLSDKYHQLIDTYKTKKQQMISTQQEITQNKQKPWQIIVQINDLISIDDIYMNGKVLKKMLIKGVSTAKPESSSLIYYALKFLDENKKVLHEDKCFNSDWWEDYGKLDLLGCRKNYMDQYKISKFLKCSMKRMKPAQVSEIQCRDMSMFTYGSDYQELKSLWPNKEGFFPNKITMVVRVYNFTQGKNCFNMDIQQKIQQSKRKKVVAIKLLNQGKIQKAYKRFQNIISFYNSGNINQQSYNQKISALMNSILCLMKQNKYTEMIPLCDMVLQKPKHGFDQDKMKINAQGIKVQGKTNNHTDNIDSRQVANLEQNQKIVDKCLYRKAVALLKTGQSKKAIECLQLIKDQNVQIKALREQAEKHLQNYQDKQKKMFKSMFESS